MKKYFLILSAAVLAFAFTACDKNKPGTKDVTFNIEVSDITQNSATVKVTPSNNDVLYYFDLVKANYFAEYASDAEFVKDYFYNYWDEMIEYYNKNGYTMSYDSIGFSKGVDSYHFSQLQPDTVYYAIAFQVDTTKKELIGSLAKTNFNTLQVQKVNLSFSVSFNDTAVFFTPSIDNALYFATLMDKDTLNTYYKSVDAFWAEYIDYVDYQISMYAQYGYNLTYDDLAMDGDIYIHLDSIAPATTYTFIAQGVKDGVFNSDIISTDFTTPAARATVAAKAPLLKKRGAMAVEERKAKATRISAKALNFIRK